MRLIHMDLELGELDRLESNQSFLRYLCISRSYASSALLGIESAVFIDCLFLDPSCQIDNNLLIMSAADSPLI